jgi:hypothetical protein
MELQGLDARSSLALVTQWEQEDRSIAEVYATLQGWSKGRLLVDKSPTYGFDRQTLERAEQLFDNLLLIARNNKSNPEIIDAFFDQSIVNSNNTGGGDDNGDTPPEG